jgi:Ni/Co efflux regulator RcnB
MLKRIVLLAALATPFVVSSIARADDDAAKPAKKAKKVKKGAKKADDTKKADAPAADDTKKADAPANP